MTAHDFWMLYVGGAIASALMEAGTFDGSRPLRQRAIRVLGIEPSAAAEFGSALAWLSDCVAGIAFWPYRLIRRGIQRIRGAESAAERILVVALDIWHWTHGAGKVDAQSVDHAVVLVERMMDMVDFLFQPYINSAERMKAWVRVRGGKP